MTKEPRIPRSRKKQEIDVTRFIPLIKEALKAFGTHMSYAEQMSKAAVTIERKRSVWKIRTGVAKAEEAARVECENHKFVCEVENPCGTGSCLFAPEDLAGVDVEAPGEKVRPSNSVKGPYDREAVVQYLHTQRRSALMRDEEGWSER